VRERRAQQQADSTTSAHKAGARCRSGQDAGRIILARFGAVLFTMSNSPVSRWRQCVFLARRAEPSALGNRSGRPPRMRIFIA
jgi:hypothetical protein